MMPSQPPSMAGLVPFCPRAPIISRTSPFHTYGFRNRTIPGQFVMSTGRHCTNYISVSVVVACLISAAGRTASYQNFFKIWSAYSNLPTFLETKSGVTDRLNEHSVPTLETPSGYSAPDAMDKLTRSGIFAS